MNLPDFIIIGETKCGTTSLYNYLIQHPNIKETYGNGDRVDESYATKEIRYFDRYYSRGLEWYKSCFPETRFNEITGEGTPMYMYRAMVPYRIHKVLQHTKFIVLLRNPIDRLYSNYQHYYKWVPKWRDLYPDFETYLNTCSDRDYFMIDKGIYVESLKKWFNYFPRDQFFIESTENFNKSTQAVYSNILKFLKVTNHHLCSFKYFRKNNYKPMSKKSRQMLKDFYEPYNCKLYELLNKNFKWE